MSWSSLPQRHHCPYPHRSQNLSQPGQPSCPHSWSLNHRSRSVDHSLHSRWWSAYSWTCCRLRHHTLQNQPLRMESRFHCCPEQTSTCFLRYLHYWLPDWASLRSSSCHHCAPDSHHFPTSWSSLPQRHHYPYPHTSQNLYQPGQLSCPHSWSLSHRSKSVDRSS